MSALPHGDPRPEPDPIRSERVAEAARVAGAAGVAAALVEREEAPAAGRFGRLGALRRNALVRRVTGYSAGSVIAAFTSELAFAAAFGWLHVGTTWASAFGFVGGAVPNYILNRRWAWNDRNGRTKRDEIFWYAVVSLAAFAASAVVTARVERWAKHLTTHADVRVMLVAAAYLAVSGVFFVGKFVAYELVVFTKGPGDRGRRGSKQAPAHRRREA
ncbi:MAG TPA: GtrA family protein [Acidimicrobiales bacterium]|nr:GtrA family protein [Acidimicrobiales bacterium]